MAKKQKKHFKTGMAPGSFVYVGEKRFDKVEISVVDYNAEKFDRVIVKKIEETLPFVERQSVTWINIHGLHDVKVLEKISKLFQIHPLVIEDILNSGQRPKAEVYDDYVLISMKAVSIENESIETHTSQLSILLGKNYVITFEEFMEPFFEPLYQRLQNTMGRARKSGSDYLAYAIMDIIVDYYFPVLERLENHIEALDDAIIAEHEPAQLQQIYQLKKVLLGFRKKVWPLREAINLLLRDETPLIKTETEKFLRDLYDHIVQLNENVEMAREMNAGLQEIYMTTLSNKMNEVMKVLSVIATIFIPLSFLAGVYGMNFDTSASPFNLPELGTPYGYIFFWIACILIITVQLIVFKRKQWF